ncbi:hypothetical protein [Campylobacter ureolyticus]|uniref:Uncharacterized protein n=1 Tax=Campylobacter ureolyticus TaxID=827 RepID=A0A9Q4PUF2_9BACT|nr:hypothetical protein [Campylobacter ureolyticus]MCZ6104049.1 hypothetical protein [Campylobacter ureolyticus]MCZ6135472.1 hypothetical protein [Campylobacter ureolyticus]MCZ6162428.1 hypothetical protein [Campylobacter ureolyticus]MCZ6171353.1 hypothetical protein [Campylobacter ureolyticus]MDU4981543.1 hypothetical protein [Campylobacter ureolyticus]
MIIKYKKSILSSKTRLSYRKKILRKFKRNHKYCNENNIKNISKNPYAKRKIKKIILKENIKLFENIKYINTIIEDIGIAKNNFDNISIDHRKLKNIDNSAILYLTACISLLNNDKKMIKKSKISPPKDIDIRLSEIGYWDVLCYNPPKYDKNIDFLKIKELKEIDKMQDNGFHADIINFFFKEHKIDEKYKDSLFDAIFEAFANVVEHAFYKYEDNINKKAWFLGAYYNNKLEFIFYDVGMGLFKSWDMGKNKISKILSRFARIFGIDNAFRKVCSEKLSKYKDKTRGNGLIAFKKFIEEISEQYESYLEISTENKLYLSNNDKIKTLNDKIKGTFIRWVIKGI